ncbi:MAG: aspartate aminotransferase family protein [Flavobacteriia bacterium]|nr:aspartate aminotransferase family protein [Flavobacteriia bacterium]
MDLRQLFLQHIAPTTESPLALEVVRAEGVYLYGPEGQSYMDFISGIGVSNIGHSHPEVVAAVQDQAAAYMHLMVYGEYVQQPQVAYARALTATLDPSLDCVYWGNSGAEAIEGAFKLAKRVTGRTEILSFQGSYHGSTHGALSAMGDETYKRAYRPLLPDHRILPWADAAHLHAITERTAAVVVEVVQAESGYKVVPGAFLQALQARCHETGALLIVDEIQTGFGRTGHLFAHQGTGIVPDILCLGKALGGGMPLGAFIASHARMQHLAKKPMLGHLTTFGGHPVSCAAGLAAFTVLQTSGWIQAVAQKEAYLRAALGPLSTTGDLSGRGLLLALPLESFDRVLSAQKDLISAGLLTDWFLFEQKALRLAPPLSISMPELEQAVTFIQNALHP